MVTLNFGVLGQIFDFAICAVNNWKSAQIDTIEIWNPLISARIDTIEI